MRTLLLANGSSPTTIDSLTLVDAQNLYVALQHGLWGPYGQARHSYTNFCAVHEAKEVALNIGMANSKARYKHTPPMEYHKIYPFLDEYQSNGAGEKRRTLKQQNSMAKQAALAISTENAPAWLKEAIST